MKLKRRITIFLLFIAFIGVIILDYWLDGCVAPILSIGNAICGEEARSEMVMVVALICLGYAISWVFFDKGLLPIKKSSTEEQK